MAVMLMIMFRRRGVLGPQQIAPVYTFGAPAIFCDGALGTCSACITQPDGSESCSLVSDVRAALNESLAAHVRCFDLGAGSFFVAHASRSLTAVRAAHW
jgi:hypothetical protein